MDVYKAFVEYKKKKNCKKSKMLWKAYYTFYDGIKINEKMIFCSMLNQNVGIKVKIRSMDRRK